MSEFIEPTPRLGKLHQFVWIHWHRFFLAAVFIAICWVAVAVAPSRRSSMLFAWVSANNIAFAMKQYASLPPGSESAPMYPPAGFDWHSSLAQAGLLKPADVFKKRAPTGEPAFFYIPPPNGEFDPSHTPMIVENPNPIVDVGISTVVYYDLVGRPLYGDDRWKVVGGLRASDGTVFHRPPQ
ncbi:MAG: hypothetical protein ACREJD_03800 [Phycisphaerales bacterium]